MVFYTLQRPAPASAVLLAGRRGQGTSGTALSGWCLSRSDNWKAWYGWLAAGWPILGGIGHPEFA